MEPEAGGREGAGGAGGPEPLPEADVRGGAGGAGGRALPPGVDAEGGVGGPAAVRVSDLMASFDGALGLLAGGSGTGGGRGAA